MLPVRPFLLLILALLTALPAAAQPEDFRGLEGTWTGAYGQLYTDFETGERVSNFHPDSEYEIRIQWSDKAERFEGRITKPAKFHADRDLDAGDLVLLGELQETRDGRQLLNISYCPHLVNFSPFGYNPYRGNNGCSEIEWARLNQFHSLRHFLQGTEGYEENYDPSECLNWSRPDSSRCLGYHVPRFGVASLMSIRKTSVTVANPDSLEGAEVAEEIEESGPQTAEESSGFPWGGLIVGILLLAVLLGAALWLFGGAAVLGFLLAALAFGGRMLAAGWKQLSKLLRRWFPPKPYITDNSARHIFRKKHGLTDTPKNRQMLTDVVKPKNYRGTDKRGNRWYTTTRADGTEVWVEVRDNGSLWDAGINKKPGTWHPKTGLKRPTRPQGGRK